MWKIPSACELIAAILTSRVFRSWGGGLNLFIWCRCVAGIFVTLPIHIFWKYQNIYLFIYSTAQVVFQNPPRTGGIDFLAHRGSSRYPTPIPSATDFSSTAFPPSSLRNTTHLPVELRGGQKFILASSQ